MVSMNDLSIFTTSIGDLAQVAQRRVAGAEVVDGHPYAELAQRGEVRPDLSSSRMQQALGDLQHEPVGRQPGASSSRRTLSDEAGRAELAGRDVDADVGRVGRASARHRAVSASACSSTQLPIGTISPLSSATSMNSPGRMQAAGRVLPAHQRLEADRRAVGRGRRSAGTRSANSPSATAWSSAERSSSRSHDGGVQRGLVAPPLALARRPWPRTARGRPGGAGRCRRPRRWWWPRRRWPTLVDHAAVDVDRLGQRA